MNEANPYIERFARMNPIELDRQMDIAKALLPSSAIVRDLALDNTTPSLVRAVTFSDMYERRGNSEGHKRGLMILEGLKPRMIVTTYLKDLLDAEYTSSFGVGVSEQNKRKHLLQVLFDEAKFPDDIDLVGAIFIPSRAIPVEAAIFRGKLSEEQMVRDILIEEFGEREQRRDSGHDKTAEWLRQMRELHGQDVI